MLWHWIIPARSLTTCGTFRRLTGHHAWEPARQRARRRLTP